MDGKPIQVVTTGKDGQAFQINEKELKKILLREDVKDTKVVVVSVAGAMRKGKSFLLNFFLRYLTSGEDWLKDDTPLLGFSWRGGSDGDTSGIMMWSEPIFKSLDGEKVAVLLMDTQGLFDRKSDPKDDTQVFALSTLISSVQVYNLMQDIQENHLQYLQLFAGYGRLALEKNKEMKPFQKLTFLVRDWQSTCDHEYGQEGGQEFLEKILEIETNASKELREHIRGCFSTINCYLMPHPGQKVANPKARSALPKIADIEEEFKEHLQKLVPWLLESENLEVKKINGRKITGKDLLEYFKSYVDTFKSGVLPDPKSVFEATAGVHNMKVMNKAFKYYEVEMDGVIESCRKYEDLSTANTKYQTEATGKFKDEKMEDGSSSNEFAIELTKDCAKSFERRMLVFLKMVEDKNRIAASAAFEHYKDKMNEIDNICNDEELKAKHREFLAKAKNIFSEQKFEDKEELCEQKLITDCNKDFELRRSKLRAEAEAKARVAMEAKAQAQAAAAGEIAQAQADTAKARADADAAEARANANAAKQIALAKAEAAKARGEVEKAKIQAKVDVAKAEGKAATAKAEGEAKAAKARAKAAEEERDRVKANADKASANADDAEVRAEADAPKTSANTDDAIVRTETDAAKSHPKAPEGRDCVEAEPVKASEAEAAGAGDEVVIHKSYMSDDMQGDAVVYAKRALEKYKDKLEVAEYIQKLFTKMYKRTWDCFVSENELGYRVHHKDKLFISFYVRGVNIILFKQKPSRTVTQTRHLDLKRSAVDCAKHAVKKYGKDETRDNYTAIAKYISEEFGKMYKPYWQCVVGYCGSYVNYEDKQYIDFEVKEVPILLYK